MAEIPGPPEAAPQGEVKANQQFEPSWLVPDKAFLDQLQSDSLRRRISRLHEAAVEEDLLSPEEWKRERSALMREANEEKFPDDHVAIDEVLGRMRDYIKREGGGTTSTAQKTEVPEMSAFMQLQSDILDPETPESSRQKLIEQRQVMYQEAEQAGLFDSVRLSIINTARRSDWDDVAANLMNLAETMENEALVGTPGYKRHPEWRGMVRAAVRGAAAQVQYEGFRAKMEAGGDETWLTKKGFSRPALARLWQRQARERFMKLGFEPHDYVGIDIERQRSGPQAQGGSAEEYLKRMAEASEEGLDYQEQQLALLKKGYNGFLQVERTRAYFSPEQFDQSLPPWYEKLTQTEQAVIRTRLALSYLSGVKRDQCMVELDPWIDARGIRLDRGALATMWRDEIPAREKMRRPEQLGMPGFRIAMATFFENLFEPGKDHLVLSVKGREIMASEVAFREFKGGIARRLASHLESQRSVLESKYQVRLEDLASAAVVSVDNFLFATGAYDSADEGRKIAVGVDNMYSEQVRTFFNPGVKGVAKWFAERGGKETPGTTEESWGGPLGEWIRKNAVTYRLNRIKELVEGNQLRLIPRRLFYSLPDHTRFGPGRWKDKTLAQALLGEDKISLGDGLYDYQGQGRGINLEELQPAELWGNYADVRSSVVKIYKHLTGNDPKDRLTPPSLANALVKTRKDPLLNPIMNDEDILMACEIMAASPERGLILGTDEFILDIDPIGYDGVVDGVLAEERIYEGHPGFRIRALKLLHAEDQSKAPLFSFGYLLPGRTDILGGERARIRNAARRRRARYAG